MADIAPAGDVIIEIEEGGALAAQAAPVADPDVVDIEADDGTGLPKHAVPQKDGSVLLPLHAPVALRFRKGAEGEVREETFAEMRMHRLVGADMRAISAASREAQPSVALARSARMPEAKFSALFDRMDAADVAAAARVLDHFLASGPKTGR